VKARNPPGWSAPLSRPLTLPNGMKLKTLRDARATRAASRMFQCWTRRRYQNS